MNSFTCIFQTNPAFQEYLPFMNTFHWLLLTYLQSSFKTAFHKMFGTYLKTLVRWQQTFSFNIVEPPFFEGFAPFFSRDLVKWNSLRDWYSQMLNNLACLIIITKIIKLITLLLAILFFNYIAILFLNYIKFCYWSCNYTFIRGATTIMDIIFWDFLILYPIFFSP